MIVQVKIIGATKRDLNSREAETDTSNFLPNSSARSSARRYRRWTSDEVSRLKEAVDRSAFELHLNTNCNVMKVSKQDW